MLSGFAPKEILGYSRSRKNGPNGQAVPMWRWAENTDEVFQKSDIITLHCPLTPETHHIVNDKTISMMKPGGMIDQQFSKLGFSRIMHDDGAPLIS